jgi:glutamate racemase
MDKAIGIFDSGIGGLTVAKEILRQLPQENIVYFGDTARVPYGTKSAKLVSKYAVQDAHFLTGFGVKLLVAACNTVSAIGIRRLSQQLPVPVIGVVESGCKSAVKATKEKKIGIIGTEATISSGIYPKIIKELAPDVRIMCKACPLLVPLVEECRLDGEITHLAVREYLSPFKDEVDTLILGCTHYPLLRTVIKKEIGNGTTLIDSSKAVAIEVKKLLESKGLLTPTGQANSHRYFVSDDPEKFKKMARLFLGEENISVEEIDINEY